MTWRYRMRPLLGVLAVALAFVGAVQAERALVPGPEAAATLVGSVPTERADRHSVSEALPTSHRSPARHTSGFWRLPPGVLPVAPTLAALSLAAVLATVVRGRWLTDIPTRLPPRAPPATGTSVSGHGVDRRPRLGVVPLPVIG
jgi:hypothetical protein